MSSFDEMFPDEGQSDESARRDIDETYAQFTDRQANELARSQELLFSAGLGVLTKLEEHGIEDASPLREMLEARKDEHPLMRDMAHVAIEVSHARNESDDIEEQAVLQRQEALAFAVASVSSLFAIRMAASSNRNNDGLLDYVRKHVLDPSISDEARAVLETFL